MRKNDVLIGPHITEKAMAKSSKNVYAFEVNRHANKNTIRNVVEQLFTVEVQAVTTVTRKGKVRRVGKRMQPKKRPDRKIAYITLKKGTIDIFPSTT